MNLRKAGIFHIFDFIAK